MQTQGEIQEMTLRNLQYEVTGDRTVERFGDLAVDFDDPYFISHFPSGRILIAVSFECSREQAVEAAVELAPLFEDMPGDKAKPTLDNPDYVEWANGLPQKIAPIAVKLGDTQYRKFLSE